MCKQMNKCGRLGALAAIATAALVAHKASGDIIAATYTNSEQFHYHVSHMPDFDQRRVGLGANGRCHCVPTSTMNVLGYIGNHGFPEVAPGAGYWQAQEHFDWITTHICILSSPQFFGAPMMEVRYASNDPPLCGAVVPDACGVNGTRWANGMQTWLEQHPSFVWAQHATDRQFSANFHQLAKMLMQGNGRLGMIAWGRYDVVGHLFGIPLVVVDGGHGVTVVRARRNADVHGPTGGELWYRDPNDKNTAVPGAFTQQSQFTTRMVDVTDRYVIRLDDKGEIIQGGLASILNYNSSDSQHLIMHYVRTVGPALGYAFSSSLSVIQQHQPDQLLGHQHDPLVELNIPGIPGVLAADLHPHSGELIFVNAGNEAVPIMLRRFDPLTGEWAFIDPPPDLWIGLGGVATGRDGAIYASCIDPAGGHYLCGWDAPDADARPPYEVLELVPHTITYCDLKDVIVAAAANDHALVTVDPYAPPGVPHMNVIDLPSSVPPIAAAADFAVNPRDGTVAAIYSDGIQIFDISDPANPVVETVNLPGLSDIQSITFDSHGNLLVAAQGTTHAYIFGDWSTSYDDHPFHGLAVQGKFFIERSRTNFDPQLHDGPGWYDVPGDELEPFGDAVPDCLADFNGDGVVDVSDLLALLSAWGPCADPGNCPQDLAPSPGGDGVVDVSDLLLLLGAWGACPGM